MKRRPRIYYSAEQKNLMWDRWQAGDSLYEIARSFRSGTFLGTKHSCRDRRDTSPATQSVTTCADTG